MYSRLIIMPLKFSSYFPTSTPAPTPFNEKIQKKLRYKKEKVAQKNRHETKE